MHEATKWIIGENPFRAYLGSGGINKKQNNPTALTLNLVGFGS